MRVRRGAVVGNRLFQPAGCGSAQVSAGEGAGYRRRRGWIVPRQTRVGGHRESRRAGMRGGGFHQRSNPAWPGSLAIAKAKAYTANAFSLDSMPLSTARLYTLTQPGHSLWGIAASNPFVAGNLVPPSQGPGSGNPRVEGGLISFGGGVPLYRNGKIVGALGVSGDTACTDHETAKRMRNAAGLNPPGGDHVDDITYPSVDGPSVSLRSARTPTVMENSWVMKRRRISTRGPRLQGYPREEHHRNKEVKAQGSYHWLCIARTALRPLLQRAHVEAGRGGEIRLRQAKLRT